MMYRDPYRHYRRRMRRGWRGRRDGYPMVFIGPEESLFLIAAAALGRWAYRHRSAFLPLAIMAGAFIAAGIIRQHHPGWWISVALITAAVTIILSVPNRIMWATPAGRITAGILARAWQACGIDRPTERAYAATVMAVAGGWLSAAIAIGPTAKPLPAIAAIATLVLGIPWWAHRRRRARVRAERSIQTWPSVADNIGLPGSKIASVVVDAWGWTARVILRKGTTAGLAIEKLSAIESGLGLRPGSARAIPDAHRADRFVLRVIETDPHAQPIGWPAPSATSITQQVELGLFEDGRPVRVVILRRNVLVGGTTGAGKSGIINVILAALAACGDVVIWGVDLKGGMELQPWTRCLGRLATTPAQAIALFQDAIAELDQRAATMAAAGRRLWEPARDMPALVIVVDEYAELPAEAQEYADSLARRGRAVAVNVLAATQRPTQEAMGNNAVRSQMDVRICLRVRERRDVDLILGQGSFSSGWHAHLLAQPGTFLISAPEHAVPERARAYLITDGQVTAHAARHAGGRPVIGTVPPDVPPAAPQWPQTAGRPDPGSDGQDAGPGAAGAPEGALWDALRQAPPEGVPLWVLMSACGMSRSWVYYRLREHASAGRAVQVTRGCWRAITPPPDRPGDGRPPPRPVTPRRTGRRRRRTPRSNRE
jgi:S-DNA-T family DNA segregation ATPase FtsK/SpoIIIE